MFLGRALLSLPSICCQHCCCRFGPQLPVSHLPPQSCKAAAAAICNLSPPSDPRPQGPQWCFVFRPSGTVRPRNTREMGERKGGATAVQNAICSSSSQLGIRSALHLRCWHYGTLGNDAHHVNALFVAWWCTKTVRKSFGK